MLLNVISTGGSQDLYNHEMTAQYSLQVPPSPEGINNSSTEDSQVVGTIEVEEVVGFGPSGEVETVKIDGRKYNFAGVNPIANKVVFDDGFGQVCAVSF
jgi:hypothetical protein